MNSFNQTDLESNEDINLSAILKSFTREKYLVILITSISTFVSFVYSYTAKPLYKGSFEIVIKDLQTNKRNTRLSILAEVNQGSSGKTQELILKSPSVLMPVFKDIKNKYLKDGLDVSSMNYKSWVKSNLEIKFKDDSQVLSITYLDNDKKIILDALNNISQKYQDFSKSERELEIKKGINFLSQQQVIFKKKATNALKKLNQFSIDNGLGDVDGFVTLSKDIDNPNEQRLINGSEASQNAGMRFENQFTLLQQYEGLYQDYSSKLKDNSTLMKNLKIKIDNLRNSLKRPNEILLSYRELKKESINQDAILSNIENQLNSLKLQQAKQLDVWKLISEPTIDNLKVFPIKSKIIGLTFLFSLISSLISALLIEKLKGLIFELNSIDKTIICENVETLYFNETKLSSRKFENLINDIVISKNKNLGIVLASRDNKNVNAFIKNLLEPINTKNIELINSIKSDSLDEFDSILLLIESGKINKNELSVLNQYLKLIKKKVIGWVFLKNEID